MPDAIDGLIGELFIQYISKWSRRRHHCQSSKSIKTWNKNSDATPAICQMISPWAPTSAACISEFPNPVTELVQRLIHRRLDNAADCVKEFNRKAQRRTIICWEKMLFIHSIRIICLIVSYIWDISLATNWM